VQIIKLVPQAGLVMAVLAIVSSAFAQTAAPVGDKPLHAELALDYSYLRSNAPPGGCGCFSLNGGSATFAWPLHRRDLSFVGDVTAANANGIGMFSYGLTLTSFTAGARYSPRIGSPLFQPFGQVLIGVAHAGGSLTQTSTTSNSNAFAANLGGGLDLRVSRRFSIRLIEADYLVTTFANTVNDHQNILRISTGVVAHF
jgi:outer membrane immunogenic protein